MLCPVKDVRRSHDCPRCNEIHVLRTVSSSIDLSVMVDLLYNLDSSG